MTATSESTALEGLRREAATCRACPLWETGTQTVFGAGPATARLMLVGEAPGYQEDRQGVPFVGPAGRLLDEALAQAGLDREALYVTNVVKHRPWTPGGRQGKNRPPKQSEINACRPWLKGELEVVRPAVLGCLGALAAKWMLGKEFKLTQQRGQWQTAEVAPGVSADVLATVHPAFVLIQPEESYGRWREILFADVRALAERSREVSGLTSQVPRRPRPET
jgi:uracil-DNA glycosylase